jgi:transposase
VTFEELVAAFGELKAQNDTVIRALREDRDRSNHERDEYKKLYELALLELERTRRHLFGRKAEAVDAAQTQLAFLQAGGGREHAPEAEHDRRRDGETNGPAKPKTKPHGRRKLPEHLPVERIELKPAEVELTPEAFERIGEEVRELIEWRPASHVRVQIVRPKYLRKGAPDANILIAEPQSLPIERGLAGPGLLAWVLVSKFCDHPPLHRLDGIFARYDVPMARSTLCGWVEATHDLCAPLVQAMWHEALKSDYIAVDATGVLVQAAERCRRGHFWVLASDIGHVLFRYTKRASKRHVRELLGGY